MRARAVAAGFGRDLDTCLAAVAAFAAAARADGVELLVLPEAALGGYLGSLGGDPFGAGRPPALAPDGPELRRVAVAAGPMVVVVGYAEPGPAETLLNTVAAVSGDGVLGRHHKVHQPLREGVAYTAGGTLSAFDTPVGRMGLQICYDKAFPEGPRTLALDGAEVICCVSAWPVSRTDPAARIDDDRQTRLFDLYDVARAAENQLLWVSANQTGRFGDMTFVGHAKLVGPGGETLAVTGSAAGLATADVDLRAALGRARRTMYHLRDRRPDAYRLDLAAPASPLPVG